MTSVLLASKFEDVDAIRLKTLVEKAGHNRFTAQQIVEIEFDMLQAIGFRIHTVNTVYNRAEMMFKSAKF